MSPRSWSARLRPTLLDMDDMSGKLYARLFSESEWREIAALLDAYADHLDSLASRGRKGGLKTASSMTAAQRKARARKGGLASRKNIPKTGEYK